VEALAWTISGEEIAMLHSLGWKSPISAGLFETEDFLLKAASPADALGMGIAETKRVMLTTYITFARLFLGTVKVEHLKGPVGIAHLGTLVAGRGCIWLLFFLALISVNLAVVNFLPLPIVDGGQFLFLLFEQLRGKPVPLAFQNAATLAGLALIGCMFLIVTYNDIRNLLGF
jgi:regulator of sigma E protease